MGTETTATATGGRPGIRSGRRGKVVELHPGRADAETALAAMLAYLERCHLSPNTTRAYRRQCRAFVAWLGRAEVDHPDAFVDRVGAEAAVAGWKRQLLAQRRAPATINQALAAVSLLYEQVQLRVDIGRARVEQPGEPDALSPTEQGRVERAAARRSSRDHAIIAVFLYAGARVEESERLALVDLALSKRAGQLRLHGKGDQVRTVPLPAKARKALSGWLHERGSDPGPLWSGQRGALTSSGITQVVLAVGDDAGLPGLRPHRLRHTYATRLRQGDADQAVIQGLLGHTDPATTARYFRAGHAEKAGIVETVFD